jgi:hypothetical protein
MTLKLPIPTSAFTRKALHSIFTFGMVLGLMKRVSGISKAKRCDNGSDSNDDVFFHNFVMTICWKAACNRRPKIVSA